MFGGYCHSDVFVFVVFDQAVVDEFVRVELISQMVLSDNMPIDELSGLLCELSLHFELVIIDISLVANAQIRPPLSKPKPPNLQRILRTTSPIYLLPLAFKPLKTNQQLPLLRLYRGCGQDKYSLRLGGRGEVV